MIWRRNLFGIGFLISGMASAMPLVFLLQSRLTQHQTHCQVIGASLHFARGRLATPPYSCPQPSSPPR